VWQKPQDKTLPHLINEQKNILRGTTILPLLTHRNGSWGARTYVCLQQSRRFFWSKIREFEPIFGVPGVTFFKVVLSKLATPGHPKEGEAHQQQQISQLCHMP
jgi:hypothetical protein